MCEECGLNIKTVQMLGNTCFLTGRQGPTLRSQPMDLAMVVIAFRFAGGDPSHVASGLIGAGGQIDLPAWVPCRYPYLPNGLRF